MLQEEEDFSVCITSKEYDQLLYAKTQGDTLHARNQSLTDTLSNYAKTLILLKQELGASKDNCDQVVKEMQLEKESFERLRVEMGDLAQTNEELKVQNQRLEGTLKQNQIQLQTALGKLEDYQKIMERLSDFQRGIKKEIPEEWVLIDDIDLMELDKDSVLRNRAYRVVNKLCELVEERETFIGSLKKQREKLSLDNEKYRMTIEQYKRSITNYSTLMCTKDQEVTELKQILKKVVSLPSPVSSDCTFEQSEISRFMTEIQQYQSIISVMDMDVKATKMREEDLKTQVNFLRQSKSPEQDKSAMFLEQKIHRLQAKLNNKFEYIHNYYKELEVRLGHFNPAHKADFISKDVKELIEYLSERFQ